MNDVIVRFFICFSGLFIVSCNHKAEITPFVNPIEKADTAEVTSVLTYNQVDESSSTRITDIKLSENIVTKDLPADFLGLSFGTSMLTDSRYLTQDNSNLVNLLKNLGPGNIRIGGNSVDRTFWSKTGFRRGDNTDSLYREDISRFSLFLKKIDWKAVVGLNLGQSNPSVVTDEASYISKTLGSSLWGFEVGNEPENYGTYKYRQPNYDYSDFLDDYLRFYNEIKTSVPSAKVAAPGSNRPLWAKQFAIDAESKFSMLTNHYYLMGPAGDPSVTMEKLLNPDPSLNTQYIQVLKNAVASSKKPTRMIEMNSCWKGGQDGISNVHASALWGLDIMLNLACSGFDGMNFHGGDNLIYSPITTSGNISRAKPLYYGMLLFAKAKIKNFTSNQVADSNPKIAVYSFNRTDGKRGAIIINKDVIATSMILRSGSLIHDVQLHEMAGKDLTSYDSTTFDGVVISSSDNFEDKVHFKQTVASKNIKISLKPISALLLIF